MPMAERDTARLPRGGVVETLLHGTAGRERRLWGLSCGERRGACRELRLRPGRERDASAGMAGGEVGGARVSVCRRRYARVAHMNRPEWRAAAFHPAHIERF
jgi:hypothetical protein